MKFLSQKNSQKIEKNYFCLLFRGIEVDQLLNLSHREFVDLLHSRARRKLKRGLQDKHRHLITKLRQAKRSVDGTHEKPPIVKTHLRNMIVVPEMVASQLGVHNGKGFIYVDVKVCFFEIIQDNKKCEKFHNFQKFCIFFVDFETNSTQQKI